MEAAAEQLDRALADAFRVWEQAACDADAFFEPGSVFFEDIIAAAIESLRNLPREQWPDYREAARSRSGVKREGGQPALTGALAILPRAVITSAELLGHIDSPHLPRGQGHWTEPRFDRIALRSIAVWRMLAELDPEWLNEFISREDSALVHEVGEISRRALPIPECSYLFWFWRAILAAGLREKPDGMHPYYRAISIALGFWFRDDDDRRIDFLRRNRDIIEVDLALVLKVSPDTDLHVFETPDCAGKLNDAVEAERLRKVAQLRTLLESPDDLGRPAIELYAALDLRDEEEREFRPRIQSLLGSAIARNVRDVLKLVLERMDSDWLDVDLFLEEAPAALSHDSNPLVIDILRCLFQITASHPQRSQDAVACAVPVLLNPNPRVQQALARLVKARADDLDPELMSEILAPFKDSMLAKVRPVFERFLLDGDDLDATPELEAPLPAAPPRGEPVAPVKDVDELVYLVGKQIGRRPDPLEVERVLDGLSRFAATDADRLSAGLKACQNRARKFVYGLTDMGGQHPWTTRWMSELAMRLGPGRGAPVSWIGNADGIKDIKFDQSFLVPDHNFQRFVAPRGTLRLLDQHLSHLLENIVRGVAAPLLSLPTHRLGFLDVGELITRLRHYEAEEIEIGHHDFILALGRAVPSEGDTPSLADRLAGEPGRVLRFLLGGEIEGEIDHEAWWLAAASCRESDVDAPAQFEQLAKFEYGRASRSTDAEPDRLFMLQMLSPITDRFGIWGCDLRWQFSLTPGLLGPMIGAMLPYTAASGGLTPTTSKDAVETIMSEMARRKPTLSDEFVDHLVWSLGSEVRLARESIGELWIQAALDGRLQAGMTVLGEKLGQALRAQSRAEKPLARSKRQLPIGQLLPNFREIAHTDALCRKAIRDCLVLAFLIGGPIKPQPKGFPALLEFFHELVTDAPLSGAEKDGLKGTLGESDLKGKAKSLYNRIVKA